MRNTLKAAILGLGLAFSAAMAADPQTRIIGGCDSTTDSRPWMVGLRLNSNRTDFESTFCGGTLIHKNWVMTAAHCLFRSGVVLRPDQLKLLIGVTELDSGQGQTHDAAEIIVHPSYDKNDAGSANDIALIKLTTMSAAPTARLATVKPGGNLNALTVGWGLLKAPADNAVDSYPTALQEVNVTTVDNAKCYPGLEDSQLCAGEIAGGKDSCAGDSGGPLLLRSQGQDTLVGVVSYGYGCARPEQVGVYTSVSSFLSWVASNTTNPTTGASDVPLPTAYSENFSDLPSACSSGPSGGAVGLYWLTLISLFFVGHHRRKRTH